MYEGPKIKLFSRKEINCPDFVTLNARRGICYRETQALDIHTYHTVRICGMELNINSTELPQWESVDYLNMAIYKDRNCMWVFLKLHKSSLEGFFPYNPI